MKLEHANISTEHPQQMIQFITAAFPDFYVRGEGRGGPGGRPWCHLGNEQFYVAITTVDQPGQRQPYSGSAGVNHLGWEVDDVDELERRMRQAGFTPNLKEHGHSARKRTYFYDPDGNDWEFVEYLTDVISERNNYEH